MTQSGYRVVHLDEIERKRGGKWFPIRSELDIEAFGVNAWTAEPGEEAINDHDEVPTGHQELYLVVTGRATFTVDGEDVDAPAGTIVFVRDPASKRKAVPGEEDTVILSVGAKPGEAYKPRGWEFSDDAMPFFASGDFQRAYEVMAAADEKHPDDATVLYNLACAEAQIGKTDEAVEHVRRAVELDEGLRELARDDSDFEPIRGHPGFVAA
jgi:mannose-6-phosphate isomerase-like protein (cupin superfamily)